jgi:cellulose synthase/poly-beta-1,6-N-acetylglucosamine synthase-like glycosyltransferase
VEDGSTRDAKGVIDSFREILNVKYYVKTNEGQGFARNYGFARAEGDYFIVFDSDVLVPEQYLEAVEAGIAEHQWDAFGGADAAHESFTATQKAISYSMTSLFTTGGIRGNKMHVGQFHPRSFNMGISRKVWEETGGYRLSRRSEDIEFSIRMIQRGFKVGLIPEAFVYHKRRTDFKQFFRQTYNFGKGRIDIAQIYPQELKPVHLLPSMFTLGVGLVLILNLLDSIFFPDMLALHGLTVLGNIFLVLYIVLLFLHSLVMTKNLKVALLSVVAAFTQLIAYGCGLMRNYLDRVLLHRDTSR